MRATLCISEGAASHLNEMHEIPMDPELGDIDGHIHAMPFMTLDEPISATIKRDLVMIAGKIAKVIYPSKVMKTSPLTDWDLWGPMLLCILLGTTMSLGKDSSDDSALVFTVVFVIVSLGASVITLNVQLLGGKLNFFQSVCTIGYCLFPLNVASTFCFFVSNTVLHAFVVVFCFIWAVYASIGFLDASLNSEKKALGIYPVFLFYLTLAWMIILQ